MNWKKKMVEKRVKNDFVSYNQVFDINRKPLLGLGLGFLDTNLLPCGHQKSDILTLIYVAPSKSKDGKKFFCELQQSFGYHWKAIEKAILIIFLKLETFIFTQSAQGNKVEKKDQAKKELENKDGRKTRSK